MLLRVLDYSAAPFGSEEYLHINYGIQDRDWQPDDKGNPSRPRPGRQTSPVSATQASKGVQLIQPLGDCITDIVAGRRPQSDLDALIRDWRTAGGDASRMEYEKDYAATH